MLKLFRNIAVINKQGTHAKRQGQSLSKILQKYLPGLIVAMIFFLIAREATNWFMNINGGEAKEDRSQLNSSIAQAAEKIRKEIPKQLDQYTTLVGVETGDLTLSYRNEIAAGYGINDLESMKYIVSRQLCATSAAKATKSGVKYVYKYYSPAPESRILGEIVVDSCK